jgi:hypothetical protein
VRIFFILLLLAVNYSSFSQDTINRKAVYVEFAGVTYKGYSINYEVTLSRNSTLPYSFRMGIGLFPYVFTGHGSSLGGGSFDTKVTGTIFSFPFQFIVRTPEFYGSFELGAGLTTSLPSREYITNYDYSGSYYPDVLSAFQLGYRNHFPDWERFIFRIDLTYLLFLTDFTTNKNENGVFAGGLSFGGRF